MPDADEAFKLDRMRALLQRLGDPQSHLPVIHVAGTKGKGSTAAMMAAVLAAGRLSNGPFHLGPSRPRRGADRKSGGALLAARVCRPGGGDSAGRRSLGSDGGPKAIHPTRARPISESSPRLPFVIFSAGRWTWPCSKWTRRPARSNNVCSPEFAPSLVSASITSSNWGPTLAVIAAEKAGIIKRGVPVLSGVMAESCGKWCATSSAKRLPAGERA